MHVGHGHKPDMANDALDELVHWGIDEDNQLVSRFELELEAAQAPNDIQELFTEETSRFQQRPRSSRGGVPVEYADHLFHLDNRPFIRQVVEDGEIDD